MDTISWQLIEKYFADNPNNLVAHHLNSCNDFFDKGMFQIFRENNPIRFIERDDGKDDAKKTTEHAKNECLIYLGGKSGEKIYVGKPVIYDNTNADNVSDPYPHYMYPNDARLRNMTYGVTIHYDVDVEFITYNEDDEKVEHMQTFEHIYLGKFPIMVNSKMCILHGMAPETRFNLGECRNDVGGYFIIGGKEKAIVCQEKFADNMLYVRKYKKDELYSYSCEVHSVSEDSSKPIRFTSVKMIAPSASFSNNQIVVDIPNIKKPVPLFILMRALGVLSDKSIIEHCLLDLDANADMVDLFIPSVHDAHTIFDQQVALEFMAQFTKQQTVTSVHDILMNYFLAHVGEDNYVDKAFYIGIMVAKLLRVISGKESPTNRDNFKFKRVETSGSLIYDLFREYYLIQRRDIFVKIDKEFYYHPAKYRTNFVSLIEDNIRDIFKDKIIEDGFKKAFKGNWGAAENTKRVGIIQDLNRLSWFSYASHLRKINLPLDPTAKVVGPHLLHNTQWGIIDPVDTPDGGNIGLHKHMAISATITNGASATPLIKWLRANTQLKLLTECVPSILAQYTKVFVNGKWVGVLADPIGVVENMKLFRRNGIIPLNTSVSFEYETNIIYIYTDSGRLARPIFYVEQQTGPNDRIFYKNISHSRKKISDILESRKYSWTQVVSGFGKKAREDFDIKNNILYDAHDLYEDATGLEHLMEMLKANSAVIDYVDTSEAETGYIAIDEAQLTTSKYFTHCEIDPSLMFGVMGNSIIYPESNQFPRNCFSCGQSRQAVSVYHSNAHLRLDRMSTTLNYGQTPLIKSRYLEHINNEQHPYGVNTIVAIMSYTGYNVEDAILINQGSIERGMFNTTYCTTYESREESSKVSGVDTNSFFANIQAKPDVQGLKEGYDYSFLDEHGLIKENTRIDDKTILIGQLSSSTTGEKGVYIDGSVASKKGQLGFVDKSFISEGEEGFRIAKVRVRDERVPAIGDKMASRAGQKGTVGIIVPESDMPFTADGTKPDLIINPHALPSRMTIGQLVESMFGKACAEYGGYGDCTAFSTKGSNYDTYGAMLTRAGFHNSGNQIMYNGFTGEQLYSSIFIGPTYYMRLKHMVKDKINYRATGKRNFLTRQTNQGRSNDGGLKIGEMERDGIMANGMSYFLNESYMIRGDQYYMAVCNKSGAIAVYNSERSLFLSPFADGPISFNVGNDDGLVLDAVSKFGRSFSIVRIPYALKLLIQELQVMNIQMRIITDDNIDQLLNLSYQSRNIDKLMDAEQLDKQLREIVNDYKQIVAEKTRGRKLPIAPRYSRPLPEPEPELEADQSSADQSSADQSSAAAIAPAGQVMPQPMNPDDIEEWDPSEFEPKPDKTPAPGPNLDSWVPTTSPEYAPYSPAYAPSSDHSVQEDDVFEQLGNEQQDKLMAMDSATRADVLREIKSKMQQVGGDKPMSELTSQFDALRSDEIKTAALGDAYVKTGEQMLQQVGDKSATKTTVVANPDPISKLYDEHPSLKVDSELQDISAASDDNISTDGAANKGDIRTITMT